MTRRGVVWIACLARMLAAQAPPLELQIRSPKASYLAGEDVKLTVHVKALAQAQIDPVELNPNTTRIRLRRSGEPAVVLTGQDHIRLFPQRALAGLGAPVAVNAGQEWDTEISLAAFSRPLPVGEYTASVTYGMAKSGEAAFRIVPTKVTGARWLFSGEDLFGVYQAGGKWFYTGRAGHDLSVMLFAVDIGPARQGVTDGPRIADFAGFPGTRPERIVAWMEGSRFCWMGATASGPSGAPQCKETGVPNGRLAEPVLQGFDGEIRAAVLGEKSAVTVGSALPPAPVRLERTSAEVYVRWEPAVTTIADPSPVKPPLYRNKAGTWRMDFSPRTAFTFSRVGN